MVIFKKIYIQFSKEVIIQVKLLFWLIVQREHKKCKICLKKKAIEANTVILHESSDILNLLTWYLICEMTGCVHLKVT